ncbi:MAG: hypothetical protein OEU46_06210 [Alphaproteobacteria bacterium]|nr:hypothetical protein [Alphaproteobacteria bacterium]
MYYKVVESFGPETGDKWQSYIAWRKLALTSFESVDGILRPDLFEPKTKDDWQNCVNADFKLGLITSLAYARNVLERYENADLIGVEIELDDGYVPKDGLLGFDIIDGYCDVSLVTNWGTDEEDCVSEYVMPNGLIGELTRALQIRNSLRAKFPEDSHAQKCEVWAIYRVDS